MFYESLIILNMSTLIFSEGVPASVLFRSRKEKKYPHPYILFWPKNVKNKNLQMNGLGAVQHSSNMQSYQHLHTVHTGCKCTTGANKQSDAIITLLPSDKVDCFRRSVVKIHFLSRKEICKNIQGHLGRLSCSYMVVELTLF